MQSLNMTIVEMRVHMDCPGCERKVTKAISKLDGVEEIDIDMDMQKVTVTGWVDQKKVLKAVRKTGRTAELWPFPYNAEYHDYYSQYYGTPANNVSYSDGYSTVNNGKPDYFTSEPTSTYNYRKHGYNGHQHGYFMQPPSAAIIDDRTTAMFSDDNVTGCSIM